jgi:hypothetical protein
MMVGCWDDVGNPFHHCVDRSNNSIILGATHPTTEIATSLLRSILAMTNFLPFTFHKPK